MATKQSITVTRTYHSGGPVLCKLSTGRYALDAGAIGDVAPAGIETYDSYEAGCDAQHRETCARAAADYGAAESRWHSTGTESALDDGPS